MKFISILFVTIACFLFYAQAQKIKKAVKKPNTSIVKKGSQKNVDVARNKNNKSKFIKNASLKKKNRKDVMYLDRIAVDPLTQDDVYIVEPPPPPPNGNNDKPNEVFRMVEQEAQFPGGMDNLARFITNNLQYPQKSREEGLEGRVLIEFVVSYNGNIRNLRILQSAGKEFDDEAMRVVKKMPIWMPAKQNGKPVNSYYTLPLNFTMDDE